MTTHTPRPIPVLSERDLARFWQKVDRTGGEEACWAWTAYRTPQGYGQFGIGSHGVYLAHAVSFSISGKERNGPFVLHSCDNPSCCNPRHLFSGTQRDNIRDMQEKGRDKSAPPRGARHYRTAITEADALAIRNAPRRRGLYPELMARYGLRYAAINAIRSGYTWKHIE